MTGPTNSHWSAVYTEQILNDCHDIIVAFDLDNVLIDATGQGYKRTVEAWLRRYEPGVAIADVVAAYERLRRSGGVMPRLGLGDPLHHRGHADALAAVAVTAFDAARARAFGVFSDRREACRAVVDDMVKLGRATREGGAIDQLGATWVLADFLRYDSRVGLFVDEVRRLTSDVRLADSEDVYSECEQREEPLEDHRPLFEALIERGATPIVVTDGLIGVQRRKLERLGLLELLRDRVLISEAVGRFDGLAELDGTIAERLAAHESAAAAQADSELVLLWHYRCVARTWSSKTPAMYGRCLHAIQRAPHAPERALASVAAVGEWQPLRFVMIGDRYDRDVEPLIDLLGAGVGFKIHLRAGKYAHLHPEDQLPTDRRADRSFMDWSSLDSFLTGELSAEVVNPIVAPPSMVDRGQLTPELIDRGLSSSYQAVRHIAEVAAAGAAVC